MQFTHSTRYDASPADVLAMLTDPAFRTKSSQAQQASGINVAIDGATLRLEMEQPNNDIPAFARAFAGETTRTVITEVWRDTSAQVTIETPGKPAGITGTRSLVADGDGTRDVFEADAKAKVPLIGGKIEKLIAAKVVEGLRTEETVARAWLAGER
ncbi:DUF2505 domain-containing protein [Nocardioides sp. Bht2]|uniref:DUF2505 domain-containing protein n=1 Tax=Nocardioides sp. Bht2 TaxID=3392297 RepID=UPI0039B5E922